MILTMSEEINKEIQSHFEGGNLRIQGYDI